MLCSVRLIKTDLVPSAGLEPARTLSSRDFKSLMSTNSIMRANQKGFYKGRK